MEARSLVFGHEPGLVAVSVERGFERADAERLAARLAAKEQGCADAVRSLTFGADRTR
jgi:hypothetical protein